MCERPESGASICAASRVVRGLPSTSPSTTTIVSLPMTTASGSRAAITAHFSRASRSACARRLLAGEIRLVDVGRPHLVRDADEREQLAPPRRLRGEDDARRRHRSSHRVTGPSFTSSTSIIAPNSPVSTRDAALAQQRDEALVERDRHLRARRVDEARPASLHRVAVERELRDDEQRAVHVGEGEVHLVVGVGEEAEADDLVGHPDERGLAVGVREADEQEKAALDATGDPIADAHFGAGDSLEEDAHGLA